MSNLSHKEYCTTLSFSAYLSPTLAFSTDGFNYGAYGSLSYFDGENGLSLGFGTSQNYKWGVNASVKAGKFNLGYALTSYNDQILDNGTKLGAQRVGTITGGYEDFSFAFSNDIIGDGKDRYRSNAVEIGYGDFSIGTYVCTNDGMTESGYTKETWNIKKRELIKAKKSINDYPWENGKVLHSPIWLGFKRNGFVQRIGVNYPPAQQATQNLLHRIIKYPQYTQYWDNNTTPYNYIGTKNPLSIW